APDPLTEHADQALVAASSMHAAQVAVNRRWTAEGLPMFDLGIGLSTGLVAAALIGSDERAEYSLVGDAVNLAQRLQQLASCGETVVSDATYGALSIPPRAERLGPPSVTGRHEPVTAFRVHAPRPDRSASP